MDPVEPVDLEVGAGQAVSSKSGRRRERRLLGALGWEFGVWKFRGRRKRNGDGEVEVERWWNGRNAAE